MKKKIIFLLIALSLLFAHSMTVLAVLPEEVEAAGTKEEVAGNLVVWFLCAIAFLKVSQKIDSFMSSLGINVGNTGGSMMAEMLIAARGLSSVKSVTGGSFNRGGSYHGGGSTNNTSVMAGGLAGMVSRRFSNGAINAMTGQGSNPISRKAFEASLKKGGEFANNVTGAIAQGNINYTGMMTGPQASQALSSFLNETGMTDAPEYSNVEIGGGRIMGTETSIAYPDGSAFGMYNADQYMAPEGEYETITAADNSTWYRQYATDTVERTPYMTGEGKIAYNEDIVKKLPPVPRRKDRI